MLLRQITCFIIFFVFFSPLQAAKFSNLSEFETYLQTRLKQMNQPDERGLPRRMVTPTLTTADFRAVTANWQRLSPGIKKLYTESFFIPKGALMYASPGFGIEIYYSTSGHDTVDPTDTISYTKTDWRLRVRTANGVPDYIDEVAFAIDSSWSMEILQFEFPQPYGYHSSQHASGKYKIVIESMSSDQYGITVPLGAEEPSDSGFASIIFLRNNWNGWNDGSIIDYEQHPEKGIRITMCHEFFHAVQYRMTNQVVDGYLIDQLPLSWIEGTASMMEELCFPEINDYTQYAIDYFTSPANFIVFGNEEDYTIYSNSIICLYFNNVLSPSGQGITFFRTLFTLNQQAPQPFSDLLDEALKPTERTWVDLLNSFHTASFYTGKRAKNCNSCIADAAMLPQWTYNRGEANLNGNVTVQVKPSSMRCVSFVNKHLTEGTLRITCTLQGTDDAETAVRIILRDTTEPGADSIILAEHMTASDTIMVPVSAWETWDEALAIVSNGNLSASLTAKVSFKTVSLPSVDKLPEFTIKQNSPAMGENIRYQLDGRVVPQQIDRACAGLHIIRKNNRLERRLTIH